MERTAQGMSQEGLATAVRRLGGQISQGGIDKIEKRDTERPRFIKEIAQALNVSEDWLLHNRQPKARNLEPEFQAMVNEIVSFDATHQIMIMATLRAQIDNARKHGAKLSSVQGNEPARSKIRK